MLDYRIETFLTVCETLNCTRAAEKLCLTQPAVTQHLHWMEKQYGCVLFEHCGKTLKLTPKGELLAAWARAMRHSEQLMRDELEALLTHCTSSAAGATKTIGDYLMSDVLAKYLRRSDRNVQLTVANTGELLKKLDSGELDFALVEGYFDKEKYGHLCFRLEPFTGICAAQHPFAGKKVELETLLKETLLVRENGSGTREVLEHALAERNFRLEHFTRVTQITSFAVLKQLVAQEVGISFVYRAVVTASDKLGLFQIAGLPIEHEWNFVYLKKDMKKDPFFDFCRQVLGPDSEEEFSQKEKN